jgi:hypothetical protein
VNCPSCGFENREGAGFCGECGASLSPQLSCPRCQRTNPAGRKFCDGCGAPLADAAAEAPAPEPRAPSSFASGRYRLKRLLGEGAKKRVYLARDERLDRDVAFALIKTEGLDEAGRTRVRREAQAMGRLGDHPHIVTVHDIGEDQGQLFIVSQYMAGGDLESRLGEAEGRRLPVGEALRIAEELCQALEHAHARGVVHRDLKPGNVWLAEDGSARLGDFGLALALDRSRITQEGMMVGTAAYMPPEQALSGEVGLRSDLYALGAVLYEMLAGRPPFLGDDVVAVISQHINTAPVAPSWHNPEIPRVLEGLILRLLAKDPGQRPESAAVVRRELARAASIGAEVVPSEERAAANPLDRLAAGVFVGRDRELGQLRGAFDDALSGRGRILMLVGEPGIGKTRTAEELATYARLRGAQVLWGRCYEGEGAPAYWPWVQIIRAYVHDREPGSLMSEMGPGAADIAEVVSEVRERLPGLPKPPELEPEQARTRRRGSPWRWWSTTCTGRTSPRCCCCSSWPKSLLPRVYSCWGPTGTWSWGVSTRSSRPWRSWRGASSVSGCSCAAWVRPTWRASSSSALAECLPRRWWRRCTGRRRAIPSSCTRWCSCCRPTDGSSIPKR